MNNDLWVGISIFIVILMLFCNKKVRVFSVLLKLIEVFENAKTGKFSIWDFICFIIFPIILSSILVLKLNIGVSDELASTLTTSYSLVFTILFGFASLLVSKTSSENKIENNVVNETFVTIMISTLISLFLTIASVIIIMTDNAFFLTILSIVIYSNSFILCMFLLMIIKRIYVIYSKSVGASKK